MRRNYTKVRMNSKVIKLCEIPEEENLEEFDDAPQWYETDDEGAEASSLPPVLEELSREDGSRSRSRSSSSGMVGSSIQFRTMPNKTRRRLFILLLVFIFSVGFLAGVLMWQFQYRRYPQESTLPDCGDSSECSLAPQAVPCTSVAPTLRPSHQPSGSPSSTFQPSHLRPATIAPTVTARPSVTPRPRTPRPTVLNSVSSFPKQPPSASEMPSSGRSELPSEWPSSSQAPSRSPQPTRIPTTSPTTSSIPTSSPTTRPPTPFPSDVPTPFPTFAPSPPPTNLPTTKAPVTLPPSSNPTPAPLDDECLKSIAIVERDRNKVLDREEYVQFCNRLGGNAWIGFGFGDLPQILRDTFMDLALDPENGIGIVVAGYFIRDGYRKNNPEEEPSDAQADQLNRVCVACNNAVNIALNRTSPPSRSPSSDELSGVMAPRSCNGSPSNCDRRVNEILYPTMHNAMATRQDGFEAPNHYSSLELGLLAGIRGLTIDSCVCDDVVVFCHSWCLAGTRNPLELLDNVLEFLDENPTEIVLVEIQINHDSFCGLWDLLRPQLAGANNRTYVHPNLSTPWPFIGDLIDANQRLVLFQHGHDVDSGGDCGDPQSLQVIRSTYEYMFETPFGLTGSSNLLNPAISCVAARGSLDGAAFGISNHYANGFLDLPNEEIARVVNAKDNVVERIRACHEVFGRLTNLFVFDFWSVGDVIQVVQEFNANLTSTRKGTL